MLAKVTARARRLQQQGQRSDPKRTAAKSGLGDRDAARAAKRGDAMKTMPEALGALEDGSLGIGHADVLARHADRLMGDDGISELERQRSNSRASKLSDPATGMKGIHGEWDPLRGEAVHRALDAEIVGRVWGEVMTDR